MNSSAVRNASSVPKPLLPRTSLLGDCFNSWGAAATHAMHVRRKVFEWWCKRTFLVSGSLGISGVCSMFLLKRRGVSYPFPSFFLESVFHFQVWPYQRRSFLFAYIRLPRTTSKFFLTLLACPTRHRQPSPFPLLFPQCTFVPNPARALLHSSDFGAALSAPAIIRVVVEVQ